MGIAIPPSLSFTTHSKPLHRDDQAALLSALTEALLPVLPLFSTPLLFATWPLRTGQQFPDTLPRYEGSERGVIVRAGSSPMADYLLLLEKGAWARPRPMTVHFEDGKILTHDLEPLEPAEVIHDGWQLDCVVDAIIEAFIMSDTDRGAPEEAVREALDDGRCADALAILLRVANLPGVSALRRRTEESKQCFLVSLGFSRSELRGRARLGPRFPSVPEAIARFPAAND